MGPFNRSVQVISVQIKFKIAPQSVTGLKPFKVFIVAEAIFLMGFYHMH
jgi:hypothetical protein